MADFQNHLADLDQRQVQVIAASVDGQADAERTVALHQLTFPVAYGLNAREISTKTGAFFNLEKNFLHSAGFVIRPDGQLAGAVYSTGAVGRYLPADCVALIDHVSTKKT